LILSVSIYFPPQSLEFHLEVANFAMAEIDEDVIPRGPDLGDIDLSDETQDFRFLLNFTYDALSSPSLSYQPPPNISANISQTAAMTPKSPKEVKKTLNPTTPTNNQTP
jgi:hypothetical protein